MTMLQDERAENPIEVGMYVLLVIFTMTLVILVQGSFIDKFIFTITGMDIQLSTWGQGMMEEVTLWVTLLYAVPSLFVIIVLVWGVKTVIKKKQYSTQQDGTFMNYEDEF